MFKSIIKSNSNSRSKQLKQLLILSGVFCGIIVSSAFTTVYVANKNKLGKQDKILNVSNFSTLSTAYAACDNKIGEEYGSSMRSNRRIAAARSMKRCGWLRGWPTRVAVQRKNRMKRRPMHVLRLCLCTVILSFPMSTIFRWAISTPSLN